MRRTRSPRSSLPSPLDGRKLWIAGIGGAGMSAYALLARAWGAEVRGWDRTHTPDVPQLGGNAGTGTGWLVVEGDESDRTIAELHPRIAVVTNVDLDHHTTFASHAEVAELFARWLANIPAVVRGDELSPYEGPLAV